MSEAQSQNRQASEEAFHDTKFSKTKTRKNYDVVGFKSVVFKRMVERMGDLEGKKVLECGCGPGWFTKVLASRGAEVWAFDISGEAVTRARDFMKSLGYEDRVHISQMSAENMTFPSDMFDVITGNAILHHLDLNESLNGFRRVLRSGGRGFFTEPLGHNPVLNLYRKMTPHLRSKDETPLRMEHFDMIEKHFPKFSHEEFLLTAASAVVWNFIGLNSVMLYSRDILMGLDGKIMEIFPFLKKYCWYSILEFEK